MVYLVNRWQTFLIEYLKGPSKYRGHNLLEIKGILVCKKIGSWSLKSGMKSDWNASSYFKYLKDQLFGFDLIW